MAVVPAPEFRQKVAITKFLINTAHSFGIAMPKVAFIAASEQMMDTMPACVEGAMLSVMASRGQLGACIGDGPLALDVAIDKESADIKGLKSEVAGDADCLLFPNIESANVFWKTNSNLAFWYLERTARRLNSTPSLLPLCVQNSLKQAGALAKLYNEFGCPGISQDGRIYT